MILFLDNDPKRAVLAYQRMTEDEKNKTIWCKTAKEATDTFEQEYEFEKVMLEHDLGEQQYANTRSESSGMEVVRFLEHFRKTPKFEKLLRTEFIIHTWNEHAGPIMAERLRKLGLRVTLTPFGM
jgi:hypothetical protein